MKQCASPASGQSTAAPARVSNLLLQRRCSGGCSSSGAMAGGECASCRKKKRHAVQARMAIASSSDPLEHEADRVADQVLRHDKIAYGSSPVRIQRAAAESAGNVVDASNAVDQVLSEPGRPLPHREFFESRFGHDFGQVRVHDNARAAESASAVNALAYTVGENVVFGRNQLAPHMSSGQHLLAHELTHVLQQRDTGVSLLSKRDSARLLQRQEADPAEMVDAETTTENSRAPPAFGNDTGPESTCPRVPTNLGALMPDPPCPNSETDIDGDLFQFCMDSDVFASEAERSRLRGFARRQRADAEFTIHGYSSREGGNSYNLNLSCHRAKRAARELENAGVPSQQIQIAARGRTTKFGPTGPDNRVVVVGANSPITALVPQRSDTPEAVVSTAVANLRSRDYRLAADAYVSRWTCGRIPSVAEMVRRTTIMVEGSNPNATVGRDPTQRGSPRLGHPNVPGLREIVLARETFVETSDPIACAEARIVDMAFHHFLASTLGVGPNDPRVHPAALFLVELAGLTPCVTPAFVDQATGLTLTPAQQWWRRPTSDPLASEPRPCPDQPLPGALDPQHQPARPAQPPTFTVSDFTPESGSAPVAPVVDLDRGVVTANSPRRAFAFDAEVTASGDPAAFPNYQVGFLQTVVADETTVEYVGGQTAHLAVPVPMRDGPPRSLDGPPWFMPPLVTQLDASGTARTRMSDSPSTGMPYEFVMPELLGRARPASAAIERNNVVNRARVRTTFNTWLAARRSDAPLDRFNTHFLRGHQVQFNLDVDVVGNRATGNYRSQIDGSQLGDATPMQLGGPTPAEISPLVRTTQVSPALPRGQANGMTVDQWRQGLRDTADDLEPLRQALGLTGRLMVRVRLDPATGRLRISQANRPTVTVEESDGTGRVSASALARFAQALLERMRKDMVLAPVDSRDPATVAFPTVLSALATHHEVRADDNPFGPEHGIGLVTMIREEQELSNSDAQLGSQPNLYDPAFWPRVNVRMAQEKYCYNFTVSGMDISSVCADQSMRTEGCVRTFARESELRVVPRFVPQRLGRETFNSPVEVDVTTFISRFVLFTPRENPGGYTFNHEMNHLMDSFDLVQNLKDRLARRIRARLMEVRRLAADHPELKTQLLSTATIQEIATQEEAVFKEFFNREFVSRGDRLHSRESHEGSLPRYRLRPGWHDVAPRGGLQGSFTDESCD